MTARHLGVALVLVAVPCVWGGPGGRVLDVRDFGATGDGRADDTAALQAAIDRAAEKGGTVVVPRGLFKTYTLSLRSHVTLHLSEGAVLLGGEDPFRYPCFATSHLWHVERAPRLNRRALFYTVGQTNVTISGYGIIDGHATAFHEPVDGAELWVRKSPTDIPGRCLFFVGCRGVRLENVTIRNAAGWSTWFLDCDDVCCQGVKIRADRRIPNGDGLHFGGCRDVLVDGCDIQSEDDALVLRAHQESMSDPRSLERVVVRNSRFSSRLCAGVRFGWSGDAPVRDCLVSNCVFQVRNGFEIRLPPIDPVGNNDPVRRADMPVPPDRVAFAAEDIAFADCRFDCEWRSFWLDVASDANVEAVRRFQFRRCEFVSHWSPKVERAAVGLARDFVFSDSSVTVRGGKRDPMEDNEAWKTQMPGLRLNDTTVRVEADLHDSTLPVPHPDDYPGVWFHLIGGNVSKEGMTADLEAIRSAGLSRVCLFHEQVGDDKPWPGVKTPIPCLANGWFDLVEHIGKECRRLNLDLMIQNCPGWSTSGGPWIDVTNAMRTLVYARKDVAGGTPVGPLPLPAQATDRSERDYRDIAVVAFPTPRGDDGGECVPVRVETNGWTFVYDFGRDVDIRSLVLDAPSELSRTNAFDAGVTICFSSLNPQAESVRLRLPRSTWMDDSTLTLACVAHRSRFWKLEVTGTAPIDHFGVRFLGAARMENWEGLSGLGFRGQIRRLYPKQPADCWIRGDSIRQLTGRPDESLPPGRWTVLRIGHVNAMRVNHPAPPLATGWECSKLDKAGIEAHFKGYVGNLLNGPLGGGRLGGVLIDSWECMRQTWGNSLEDAFARHSDYVLRKWFPALFGWVVDSPARSREFLLDWTAVRAQLIEENYFRRFAELSRAHGLEPFYETAFGDVVAGDPLRFWKWVDAPMCEFWQPHSGSFVGSFDFKSLMPCVSSAHLYGKRRVAAEALTSFDLTFDESFRDFKRVLDLAYCRGVTYPVFQAYTHNPNVGGLPPGSSYGAPIGSPFLRGQTWWPYMRHLVRYCARCTRQLERGLPVVDVLRYLGDDFDHRPREPEEWVGNEYAYKIDYLNGDVLENRLDVRNGQWVLPDGMTYSVLWIPDGVFVSPRHEKRLAECRARGGRVVRGALSDAVAGLRPHFSFKGQGKPDWYHRREGNVDIWYVAGTSGDVSGAVVLRTDSGSETLPLKLASGQSVFIVGQQGTWTLTDAASGNPYAYPCESAATDLGSWTVDFPNRRMRMAKLVPWRCLDGTADERAFSGTASYATTVVLPARGAAAPPVWLDLGEVRDIAEVFVNGQPVACLWSRPYACDVSGFVHEGVNELKVNITSSWYNRLVLDAGKAPEDRQTWTLFGPVQNAPLHDSGLLGPVRVNCKRGGSPL